MSKTEVSHQVEYEVEVQHRSQGHWYVRRSNFESYEEAENYVKYHQQDPLFAENFRIVRVKYTTRSKLLQTFEVKRNENI